MKKALVLGCFWAMFGIAASAAEFNEAQLKEMMMLQDYRIEYHGEDGKPIGFAEFAQQLTGKSLTVTKNTTTKVATVSVSAAKPDLKKLEPNPASIDRVDFAQLSTVDGKPAKADPRKLTLVSFYFAECAPCIKEIPALNQFRQHYSDVDMVAMTLDDAETTTKFVQKFGLNWPIVADAWDLMAKLGVNSFPMFALFDADGKLIARDGSHAISASPIIDSDALRQWIDRKAKRS